MKLSNWTGASHLVHRLRAGFALLVVVSALNTPGTATAQPVTDRSLTADNTPATEPGAATNAASVTVVDPNVSAPNAIAADPTSGPNLSNLTREQLESRVKTLTASLASANTESEYFREQWTELKLRDEALGVEALTVDERAMQDKLVQAVKELWQTELKRREALVLLDKLLYSSDQMLQSAPDYDPKIRADYEVATRAAKGYLAGHSGAVIPMATGLTDGQVVDTKPELNSVILNVGKAQGVKEGMPFLIFQSSIEVGTVKIVLARDQVSAAQVESLKPGTVLKIGDRAMVQQ